MSLGTRHTLAALCALAFPTLAAAQAPLLTVPRGPAGFGEGILAPNDDGSTPAIDLSGAFPVGINFFGTIQNVAFVNNNGNLTFVGPVSGYTPVPFPVAARPMIAPFWGDVDTRNRSLGETRNLVYYDVSPGRFLVTWYDVGYFSNRVDLLNSFQALLVDQSAAGAAGDFDVEFRYNRCEWTTGDASGGSGGLGGTPAQAGFDAGDETNFRVLPGSGTMAVLDLCTTSNVDLPGVWRFQIRSGNLAECGNGILEAGEECDDGNTTNGDGCNERCEVELDPGAGCTTDIDCRSGFCTDGVCCGDRCGAQCERCDLAGSLGVCSPTTGAPVGARPACAGSGTLCGGVCDGTDRTSCVFPGEGVACDEGSFCVVGAVCDGAGACSSGMDRGCSDGLSCTADGCDESTRMCTATLVEGCLIDGVCVAEGALNPDNPCELCDSAVSTSAWSPAPAGGTCDDDVFCTVDDVCDGLGACTGSPRPCDDGLACTTDICDETALGCVATITDGCLIEGVCVAEGPSAGDACLVCDPDRSRVELSDSTAPECTGGDAGVDGGVGTDAGVDGGVGTDAGTDAGTGADAGTDAGMGADAGTSELPGDYAGGACSSCATGGGGGAPGFLVIALVTLGLVRRRR
ncbi:MAG: hypothetical protein KF901_24315 [Myxococcales bacterium]|nr:hypothetical protein [Myxococcales bacterium]